MGDHPWYIHKNPKSLVQSARTVLKKSMRNVRKPMKKPQLVKLTNSPLEVMTLPSDQWSLVADITIEYYTKRDGVLRWYIKKGFHTNFRSGGTLISPFYPKIGKYAIAWLAHDAGYGDEDEGPSRAMTDALMYAALRELGMGPIRAWLAYKAVRIAGKSAYGDKQKHMVDFRWDDK